MVSFERPGPTEDLEIDLWFMYDPKMNLIYFVSTARSQCYDRMAQYGRLLGGQKLTRRAAIEAAKRGGFIVVKGYGIIEDFPTF